MSPNDPVHEERSGPIAYMAGNGVAANLAPGPLQHG